MTTVGDVVSAVQAVVTRVVREQLAPLSQQMAEQNELFKDRMKPSRRDPNAETQREAFRVLLTFYDNMCPACLSSCLVRHGIFIGEFDHVTDNVSRNGAHEVWPICRECNRDYFTGRRERSDHRAFDEYQRRRRMIQHSFIDKLEPEPPEMPAAAAANDNDEDEDDDTGSAPPSMPAASPLSPQIRPRRVA